MGKMREGRLPGLIALDFGCVFALSFTKGLIVSFCCPSRPLFSVKSLLKELHAF
jgi:hypothetical protein